MATGLYGKLPAHGDFVRRGLPDSFVGPWDAWLQAGIAEARDALGEDFAGAWAAAPAWCFRLPAGACGPDAVAGLLVPSEDMVGRLFPVTLARLLAPGEAPGAAWYPALDAAARRPGQDADTLLAAITAADASEDDAPAEGWWRLDGARWDWPALPPPELFRVLAEGGG
ncbi:type VI secretion system-associated protein TagF [Roseomonas stagni]|uniref:Type VI secretion system-associated protein TagF n=1 Tax=Falsiroseomonas algicola TaxID=2716930 RepID=A0A6M1LHY3_9PROT|nr:type VI secretion system-associated protein TagF [Falsiroseomonas algicola]NGM19861.1 type VI secretion system-associated protein TagF [Falsiroseomonas algicola]